MTTSLEQLDITNTQQVFQNKDTMIELLKRDKHRVLEGACTEHLYVDEVLKPLELDNNYTTNWWAAYPTKSYQHPPIIFKLSYHPLTNTDIQAMELLIQKGMTVYYVYLNRDKELKFVDANIYMKEIKNKNFSYIAETMEEFLSNHSLKVKGKPLFASKSERIESKQNKAISFLRSERQLEETTLQRYFANHFLMVYMYYTMNIDGFIVKSKKIFGYEVKFKYSTINKETKIHRYGINTGLRRLFYWLKSKNIPMYHFILNNGTRDKNITAIDGLLDPKLKTHFTWCYCQINHNLFIEEEFAPEETSIDGKKRQKVYYIDAANFKKVQTAIL